MTNSEYAALDSKYIANTYKRFPVTLEKGKGAVARDVEGKEYVDFGSGIGVNSLGYCFDKWVSAVTDQINTLQHTSNLYSTMPDIKLARKLCDLTGYKRVFFGNSGAEANECAIKTARKYGIDNKGENCTNIITFKNSFHGRTIATLEATGQDVFHKSFFPFTNGFKYVPIGDRDEFLAAVDDTVCGVMIELVQGEGGVIAVDKDFVKFVEEVCREKNLVFIVDEVQTGVGRTGTLLASEQLEVKPNVTTLAKGLGGGLPIGACLMDEMTENVLAFGDHGSTFGGNPVVCAGALAVLEELADNGVLTGVREKAEYIVSRLEKMPKVVSVSGLGLMIGIELENDVAAAEIAAKCVRKGLLILTAKTKLRMLPPLNITKEETDRGLSILEDVLTEK
ncbi:MAG: aspartate aminotransferase family protein [Clostridia bacterium]|nr:aspartate aminotransferase family protein [Clostridia bacterium]